MVKINNFFFLFLCLLGSITYAQKVSNVTFRQEQSTIIISYDLETKTPCKISLFVSIDDGKTWQGPLKKVTGDVGAKIATGNHSITWNVLEEFEELRGDKIKFQVRADASNIETVVIGSQEWTVKNLNVSTYRNGDVIPEVKDPKKWQELKTGAWCYYDNDPENGKIYGKLYNWYAVNDPRGIAPEGFHIPSNDEWKTLNDYIDSEKIKCVKKKVLREKHQYELGDMMESRFKGLPGGARLIENIGCFFTSIDFDGAWWSSTENVTQSDLYNTLNYYFWGVANDYSFNKQFGFSVRCIKD
ncbi:MAG: fibrobacter succinogenes major paralogous domain-containing protein [Flavobacterium sp.]|uniref:fibrobacter succinogenes major paralogous domain-containing protein n=1 Tax=Flavobacterium sp. TaxID=239 RepID=UPI003BD99645